MLKYLLLISITFLISCAPTSNNVRPNLPEQNDFLRADPVYINWLEQQSLLRQAPDKIRIVSGSNLAWINPSASNLKNKFLKLSPVWFYANPLHFKREKSQTYLTNFLQTNTDSSLKKIGINSIFISPLSQYNFNTNIGFGQKSTVNSLEIQGNISYNLAEQIVNTEQYHSLQNKMIIGSEMLKPSLGLGADFILALHAVRDYPGLFMMVELPRKLWSNFPTKNSNANNFFNPYILTKEDENLLVKQKIIPKNFARDYIVNSPSFALSPPIRGVDSLERRWIYRFADNPNTAILNYADPSLTAQKLFTASIIQQVGILRQALVGINISDLWGQEVVSSLQENTQTNFLNPNLAGPALSALSLWNKSAHNYGAYTIINEAFPMELIPSLLNSNTDFVADTIIMPALEQALLTENSEILAQNVQKALELNISFSSLWRGSPDVYQKYFLSEQFTNPNSMTLATNVAKINIDDLNLIQKIVSYPKELQNNQDLLTQYAKAKKIQFSYLAFQALLPGLPFLSGQDLRGIIIENNILPPYNLNKDAKLDNLISWHLPLEQQLTRNDSLANQLKKIYDYRQLKNIAYTEVIQVLKTKPELFALVLKDEQNKYYISIINLSSKNISAQISLPSNKQFISAKEILSKVNLGIWQNNLKANFSPWQLKFFELF